jgi:hypothetical protein
MATIYNPGAGYSQTSGFRTASRPNHNGIDYSAKEGTSIPAAVDGKVVYSGEQYSIDPKTGQRTGSTYGYTVIIEHIGADGNKFYTLYAHMKEKGLAAGTTVKAGDTIGQVGNTGQSRGSHLHYEVIDSAEIKNGQKISNTNEGGPIGLSPSNGRVSPNTFDNWPSSGVYNWWERANDASYNPYLKFKSFITSMLSPIVGAIDGIQQIYTSVVNSLFQIGRRDPAVVDIDGDGIETTNVKDGAYFDHDGNGFAEQTGGIAPDDGLLVMDRNGDGIINDGKELFGDQTILSNGQRATNAFEALREQDSNADGKIDVNDAAFNQIKVWQDIDGDGYKRQAKGYRREAIGNNTLKLAA